MPNPLKPAFLVFAVFLVVSPMPVQAVPFVTLETEIAMGKEADTAIIAQFGIYQDKSLQLYVNKIGQKLVYQLSDKVFSRYYFRVMDSPLGGAIASPENAGGWLTVSTALFQQINMGYGREAEIESDEHGILSGSEAGYNSYGMANFLKSLRRKEIMSGQSYHSFQASHPETKDRVVKAGLLAGRMKTDSTEANFFQSRYLNQIRGLVYEGKKHPKDLKRYEPKYVDVYEVKKGDTFQSIAEKELGDKRQDLGLTVLNGRRESSQPKAGELIKIIRSGKFKKNKTLKLESYSLLETLPNK